MNKIAVRVFGVVLLVVVVTSVAYFFSPSSDNFQTNDPIALENDEEQIETERPQNLRLATTLDPKFETTSETSMDEDADETEDDSTVPSLSQSQNLENILASSLRYTADDRSPWAKKSASEISYAQATEPSEVPADRGNVGIFHENCNFSHFAYDDSLVFPDAPGAAHLHMFFGNSNSHAFSDNQSLRNTGASTCAHNELNRSSYWAPAVLTRDGSVLIPDVMNVYYTESGKESGKIQPFPEEFGMISGNAMASAPQEETISNNLYPLYWKCGWHDSATRTSGSAGSKQPTIPDCDPSVYSHIEMGIQFPHCWNGKENGLRGDHKSHIIFPPDYYSSTCPDGYIAVPSIIMRIHFKLSEDTPPSSEWFLSSDVRISESGEYEVLKEAGSSIHADWRNGWNDEALQIAVDTCLNVNRDCWRNLGDGKRAILDEGQYEPKTVARYDGPFVATVDELESLCPGKNFSGVDAAYCDTSVMKKMMSSSSAHGSHAK